VATELNTVPEHLEYDEVAPDASAMIESMRAYGYTLSAAIADLIDNSIAAGCSTVWLHFQWSGADSWIRVTDDGRGMDEGELRDAMRLGSRNPLQARAPTDLGRFGLGLKTASLSQCRRLTVASRRAPGFDLIRRWDLEHLSRGDVKGWQLLKAAHRGSETRVRIPEELRHGTVVLWEVLDRIVGNAEVANQRIHRHFQDLIEQVEAHLAMVFHRYLDGIKPRLRIFINDQKVAPWDPFVERHPATDPTPEELIPLPGFDDPIVFRGFVLPHKDRLGDGEHRAASGPAGWNAQQGFYLYRNERLIIAGSWLGLGGSRPWTKEEHYKLARIRVDIPNTMDHLWQLDVKKSTAQPPPLIKDRLTGLADGVRKNARAVYAHRGKYGPRTRKEELHRPWKVVRKPGVVSYRIDRDHPIVSAIARAASRELREELETMLRILEETVPVEQIWLDASENPEGRVRPFHGITSGQMRSLVEIAYGALRRNRSLDHQQAIAELLSCEEFSGDEPRAIIATLNPQAAS
jgi:hypothetical protein